MVGLVLAVQAVLIAVLTNGFSLPVTATFMTGPPGSATHLHHLFDLPTGWRRGLSRHLGRGAAADRFAAGVGWYRANLLRQRNYGRWIEYFFSSSIMIVLIAQLVDGDIAALMAIFAVNACMILFGLLMERYESPETRAGCPSGSARSPAWCPGWRSSSTPGRRA